MNQTAKKKIAVAIGALAFTLSAAVISSAYADTSAKSSTLEKVGDFALIDHQGAFLHLSRYRHKKALVIYSEANTCQSTEKDLSQLRKLRKKWQNKDVDFFMMNSVANEDRNALIKTAEAKSIDFPILDDSSQLIAEKLNITKAGQLVIVDPDKMTINYRGPIDSEINGTLKNVLAGTAQETKVIDVSKGCDLAFPAKDMNTKQVPDYVADIAPIIEENCAYCHREGGIGPFAMNNYMMVKGFAPMIQEVLLTKRMPPMQVDPHIGKFTNANYISDKDLQTLVHWIDAGAPRGDNKADPLTTIAHTDMRAWQLGEPDYVVTAPEHKIPATGVIDYYNELVELSFDEDKWVRAVQFIPGAPSVLHHLLTYVVPETESFIPGQEIGEAPPPRRQGGNVASGLNSRKFLEGYAPGKIDAMVFPENTGVFVPKGHKLAMQFHYTTNGKAEVDKTLLGLYFYDKEKPPAHEYLNSAVATMFKIPPYEIEDKEIAHQTFQEAVVLYGMRAHMHFRGKHMEFTVEYPDGRKEMLLSVPNYSYSWQPTYQLEKPVTLPAGTKVYVTGAFDNSIYNPANPDPSKELSFGLQSWDEMFIGYLSYYKLDPDG